MNDATKVAEVLTSASNHKTATLLTSIGLAIMAGSIYGSGKLVGRRRAKKELRNLPQVVQDNVRYFDAQSH